MTSIAWLAFIGCSALQSIEVSQDNECFMSRDNCLLSKDGTRLLFGCRTSVIPDGVTSISGHAFVGCSGLKFIRIPDSVTEIEEGAFWGCSGLQSIEVSRDNECFMSRNNYLLSKDGTRLLCGCKASVIPDGVTCIDGGAFNGCSGLKFIKIPDSVTSIGNCAFEGCSDLQSVRIPNGVIKIGYDAFRGCCSLQSIEIPSNVADIEECAFDGCDSISSLILHYDAPADLSPEIVDGLPISDRITLHVPVAYFGR